MNKLKFEELNLSTSLLKTVLEMGFNQATPIQAQAIPEVLAGNDIIGQASTGTGKTAAFGLPAIDKIDLQNPAIQTLVLCPTRELAMQVAVEINKFLKYKNNIFALPIYGGQPINTQLFALRKRPKIIIGTPGRVLDHISRGTLRLDQVKMVVIDEADEMLNMGFRQDIELILQEVPKERQTLLFSATMSAEILQLTKRYQKNPKHIRVAQEKMNVPVVEQIYFNVGTLRKIDVLMQLFDAYNPKLSIVFCNTKRKVDEVSKILHARGYFAEGIHGDVRQAKRDRIMGSFRKGRTQILVATDVAARGIDVANVEIVFNYEIPRDVESYVHRIGRTGRAGKTGKALSLIAGREFGLLRDIRRYTNTDIIQQDIPVSRENKSFAPIENTLPSYAESRFTEKRTSEKRTSEKRTPENHLEEKASRIFGRIKHSINKDELVSYLSLMKKIGGDKHSTADVAAALLKMVIEEEHQKSQQNRYN